MFKKNSNQRGFTLIEVVIVLALGALIMLVVFQAISGAQKANRDNTRKSEAGRLAAILEQYASNNGGRYPAASSLGTLSSYDNAGLVSGTDPKYKVVGLNKTACPATLAPEDYSIFYELKGTREYVLGVCLEAGGSLQIHP